MTAVQSSHRNRLPSLIKGLIQGLTAGLLLAGLAAPAGAQMSEIEVRSEIAFAKGLASDWAFVDLAEEVLRNVRSEGVSGKLREELTLINCEVYVTGARFERDLDRGRELFEKALASYADFIAQNPFSDLKPTAEAGLVNTSAIYAVALDRALEEAVGPAATELTEKKVEVLTEAVKLTQDLIGALSSIAPEDRSEQNLRELAGLMLNRGQMLGEIGRASQDGTYFFDKAQQALEEMVFEFGEGTPPALQAYKAIGDVNMWRGNTEEAAVYYEAVVEAALPRDPKAMERIEDNNGGSLTSEQIATRYLFLELAMEGLLESLVDQGEIESACNYGLHYYNLHQKEGLHWAVNGYKSLLAVASTLLDAGGFVGGDQAAGSTRWFATEEEMKEAVRSRRQHDDAISFALKLANTVNEENKGNILQVRAQKLISEISNRPGVVVTPDVLVQAAQGEYNDGNYDGAIQGCHRVMRALESLEPSDRVEYGARVMNLLANAHRRSERYLEAAMAFREGVTVWRGDPEFDGLNASGYRLMIKRSAGAAPGDTYLESLLEEAEQIVTDLGRSGTDEILFTRGMKKYRAKDWDAAIKLFEQIEEGADYYEKALVQTAVCRFRKGEFGPALAAFEDYIERYVKDPSKALQSDIRKARRTESLAAAEFYRGLLLSIRAKDDPSLHARIVELLTDYHERYPTQDSLAPWTMRLVLVSHVALGQRAGAREMFEALVDEWPDSKQTGQASVTLYNHLSGLRKDAGTSEEEQREVLRDMAELLRIGNSLGTPDFKSLRNESLHWRDLGEFVEAERVLVTISERFGGDSDRQTDMTRYVLPDLGLALLENGKVADAKAILTPLVADAGARPSKSTVLNWVRSVSGWLTGGGETPVREVPGAGGTEEEWLAVIDKLNQISRAGEKWLACDWYEEKLMIVYAYHVWSREDQRKEASAKNQLSQLDTTIRDTTYSLVEKFCSPPEEEDPAMIERLGGGVLQARYQYVARAIR